MAHNPTILAIDDEPAIQRLLKIGLSACNFKVIAARDARDAKARLVLGRIDLVLLDMGLPDGDGMELLAELRRVSQVPIIILSVRGDEAGKVRAFELGAYDYVAKPFGMGELIARIRVALRHELQSKGASTNLRLGEIEIDLIHRRVMRDGAEIALSPTEYKILHVLAEHAGKVVTHDFILRRIRGEDAVGDHQYLRVYVRALRNKLGDTSDHARLIRTEMGVGYRLIAD
jgi:two-component system KDP operon response regulator KdpE